MPNNISESGPMGGGFLRQPGQYQTLIQTAGTESTLPLRQAIIMGAAIAVAQLVLLAIFAVLTAAFGWWMVLALIEVGWLGVCVFWIFKSGELGLPIAIFLLVGAALPVTASPIIPLAYSHPDTAILVIVAAVMLYFLPAVLIPAGFLSWRMGAEVSDPSYSAPRVAIERMTPTWPWTQESEATGFSGDPDTSADREQITAMLTEAIAANSPQQIIKRDTIIATGVTRRLHNSLNGMHTNPQPGETIEAPQPVDQITRQTDEDGRILFWIRNGEHDSVKVPLDTMRHFVWQAVNGDSTLRHWRRRGVSDEKQQVIRRILELGGFLEAGRGEYRETVTWLVDKLQARLEFDRIFLGIKDPPTPPENENKIGVNGEPDRQTEENPTPAGVGG